MLLMAPGPEGGFFPPPSQAYRGRWGHICLTEGGQSAEGPTHGANESETGLEIETRSPTFQPPLTATLTQDT